MESQHELSRNVFKGFDYHQHIESKRGRYYLESDFPLNEFTWYLCFVKFVVVGK